MVRYLTLLTVSLLFSTSVRAELRYCNETPYEIYAAVHYLANDDWHTKGWFTVEPGTCTTVIRRITNRYYYLYGEAVGDLVEHETGSRTVTWGKGGPKRCVHRTSRFDFPGHRNCDDDEMLAEFTEVDTENYADFDWIFTSSRHRVHSLQEAARLAEELRGQAQATVRTPPATGGQAAGSAESSCSGYLEDAKAATSRYMRSFYKNSFQACLCDHGVEPACAATERTLEQLQRWSRGMSTILGTMGTYNEQDARTHEHRRRELCKLNLC